MYGISTGFGALVSNTVAPELQRHLQVNLLRSHAAGTGAELPAEVVRGAMAVRANGLMLGHSGVRPLVIERVAAAAQRRLRAAGAAHRVARGKRRSGAHRARVSAAARRGRGVRPGRGAGQRRRGAGARSALEPLELESKEGLALINGTHFMSAIGALLACGSAGCWTRSTPSQPRRSTPCEARCRRLTRASTALRPLAGQARSAANIAAALHGSRGRRRRPVRAPARLQDAYSLRCAAQVHGAAREAFRFFAELVLADLNAVTDNPLVFDDPPEVISAGNFHGQSLAVAFDTLRLGAGRPGLDLRAADVPAAVAEPQRPAAGVLDHRCGHLERLHGRPVHGRGAGGRAAGARAPGQLDSIPTSDNQEDHVSMGMTAALMALDGVDRLERVVAIELLCACQALDCDPGEPATSVVALHAAVRELVRPLTQDRPPADDLAPCCRWTLDACGGAVAGSRRLGAVDRRRGSDGRPPARDTRAMAATPRPLATSCAPRTSPTRATPSRSTSTIWRRRRPLARALQPRVPPRVRRVAARLPADAPAGAGGRAAAHHRPLGGGDLLLGRPAEPRLVHHQLHADLRRVADRLPRRVPAGRRHALVPACIVRAYARPQRRTFGEDSGAGPD